MPVLPLVGSTIVAPGFRTPRRSASSTIETAMRSLTLPPGLSDSTLAATIAPPGFGSRFSRTIGVRPTSSRTDFAIFGVVICGTSAARRSGARPRERARSPNVSWSTTFETAFEISSHSSARS